MRQLLQAGVHFGHQTRYWSPTMAPYIFGDRNKIHIINLEKTLPMLNEAMNYLGSVVKGGGAILFVGTKRQAGRIVREAAIRCGSPYVDHRWLGGMLTNYKTVKNSIARLKELEQRIESGVVAGLSKKEALTLERERGKLSKTLSGIKDMNGLPDALFVIDVEQEYIAVAEANKLGIPVVAVVDSNCSVKGIDYIIPGNDDSTRAIKLYLEAASDAVLDAKMATSTMPSPAGDDYIEVDAAAVIEQRQPEASDAVVPEPPSAVTVPDEPAEPEAKDVTDDTPASAQSKAAASPADEAEPQAAPQEYIESKKISKKKVVRKKRVGAVDTG